MNTTEPNTINAGDSLSWDKSLSDYPAPTWTLKYSLVSGTNKYAISSVANGTNHSISVTAVDSAKYHPGKYRLVAFVESGVDRVTLYEQPVLVLPDHNSPADLRPFAEQVVDAIEAVILKKATKDQQAMAIDGKSLTRYTPEQLIVFRDRFKREARLVESAKKAKLKGGSGGSVQVRFK